MRSSGTSTDFWNGDPASVWRRARPRFSDSGDRAERLLADAGCGTRDHSHEVASLAAAAADRLGLDADERRRVIATAHLHDIGKSQVPASVVDKPGPLSPGEWQLMHLHTVAGERLVIEIGESISIARAVRHSHERWDGHGYPDGLRGQEIPLASRIVFCADAFQAICADRPYRAGRSAAEAIAEIRRCAGTQFDPRVVAALIGVLRPRLHRTPHEGRRRGRSAGVLGALAAGLIGAGFALVANPAPPTRDAEAMALAAIPAAESDPLAPPGLTELGAVTGASASGERRDGGQAGQGRGAGPRGPGGQGPENVVVAPEPPEPDYEAPGAHVVGSTGVGRSGSPGGQGGSSGHGNNGGNGQSGGQSGGNGTRGGGNSNGNGNGSGGSKSRGGGGAPTQPPGGSGSAPGQSKQKH